MNSDTSFEYALARAAEGDLAGAAAVYQRLLTQQPAHYKAWNNLGRVYEQQGQLAEALEAFTRAAELAPDVDVVLFNYAAGLHKAGEFSSATAAWQRVVALTPENADAHYNLAASLHKLEDLNGAIASYRAATRMRPEFYEAWSNLADCLYEADAHLHSFEASMEAACLETHAVDYFNMGRIAELLEDRENAAKHYRKALDLDPADTATRLRCAEVLVGTGSVEEAITLLRNHPVAHPLIAHTINAIAGEPLPRASKDYVRALFDGFADSFDATLSRLGYQGPRILRTMLDEATRPEVPAYLAILDLGCGTGLLGTTLTSRARRMVGVDLSAKMLAIAESRGLYDALIEADILDYLRTISERFDLVAATDVFNYFGDLKPLLTRVAPVLGGPKLLTFSVEDLRDIDGEYRLQANGRYGHSSSYVREQLTSAGFQLLAEEVHTLRHESRQPVNGRFYCARG